MGFVDIDSTILSVSASYEIIDTREIYSPKCVQTHHIQQGDLSVPGQIWCEVKALLIKAGEFLREKNRVRKSQAAVI